MVYIPSHISFAVYSVKVKTELNMKNCAKCILFILVLLYNMSYHTPNVWKIMSFFVNSVKLCEGRERRSATPAHPFVIGLYLGWDL